MLPAPIDRQQKASLIAAPAPSLNAEVLERVLLQGDLRELKSAERVSYYRAVCESLGLNPLTRPFEYVALNGKLQLYAKKECTEQLRQIHAVSIVIPSREVVEGCFVVTAVASMPSGRQDSSLGATPIETLKGESRANAMMKAETKAKRRVTLSICGLAFLDESEVDAANATRVKVDPSTGEILSGTAEAAQRVGEEKVRVLKGEAPASPVIDAEPVIDEPPTTLQEDIEAHPPKERKGSRAYSKYDMYDALGPVKDRFIYIGAEAEYRAILGKFGATKRDELPDNDGGKAARACYKLLTNRISEMEVEAMNTGKIPNPFLPTLTEPPREIQPFCKIEANGVEQIYQWVGHEKGGDWVPWNPPGAKKKKPAAPVKEGSIGPSPSV